MDLTDYILKLWAKVGYTPKGDTISDHVDEGAEKEVIHEQAGGSFTPMKVHSDPELFKGVCIKAFSKDTDHAVIMEFLIKSGLEEKHKDNVDFKHNGSVIINNLENFECKHLISAIHNNDKFGKKLFCNGLIPLTPEKAVQTSSTNPPAADSPCSPSQSATVSGKDGEFSSNPAVFTASTCPPATCSSGSPDTGGPPSTCSPVLASSKAKADSALVTTLSTGPATGKTSPTLSPNQSLLNMGAALVISELDNNLELPSDFELVRRHSLSMRDVPPGSLAAEILNPRRKSILNDIKDISKKLSDFESCQSSLSSSVSESDDSTTDHSDLKGFKTIISKKSSYRQKRKASLTPRKEDFMKKQNKTNSPQGQLQ